MNLPLKVLLSKIADVIGTRLGLDDTQHAYVAEALLKRHGTLLCYDTDKQQLEKLSVSGGGGIDDTADDLMVAFEAGYAGA